MATPVASDPKFVTFMTGCPRHDAGDTGLYNWALSLYNMAIQAPTLASIAPTTIAHGSGNVNLTCTGTNLTRGSIAQAGATGLSSGVPNSTKLNATIPSAMLTAAGTLSITILAPDGQVTAAQTFTIS